MNWSSNILNPCYLALFATLFLIPLQSESPLSENEAEEIARDAYIYGYPLVTMEMTRRVMTQ